MTNQDKEILGSNKTKKSEKVKPFQFNPFSAEFCTNPYPAYHRLHSENPISRSIFGGDWVVTHYEDVKAILRDRRVYAYNRPKLIQQKNKYFQNRGKSIQALADASNKFLSYMNPPDHGRLRSLVSKAFSPKVVERMRPQIQTIVDESLEKVLSTGEMDIIGDLAAPLPVKVIASMLGVPYNDAQEKLHQWARISLLILF